MRILAIDGSAMQIATNPNDIDSFLLGTNGQRPYNLLHLNALDDLKHHIYINVVIQKAKLRNEHKSFVDMVDRSDIKNAIVIADRGYESYNNMTHIQEKGWKFLIRVKDGNFGIKSCLDFPQEQAYDVEIYLKLTCSCCHKMREMNPVFHFSHRTDFYISINLMTLGGCCALYFMVENKGYAWYNQNVENVDKPKFKRRVTSDGKQ